MRTHATILLIAVTFFLIPQFAQAADQSGYEGDISEGLDYLEEGKTREALECFSSAVLIEPQQPLAHDAIALTLLMGKRPDNALEVCEASLALDKDNPAASYIKGLCLLEKNEVQEACIAFANSASEMAKEARDYTLVVSGGKPDFSLAETPTTGSTRAYALLRDKKYAECAKTLLQITNGLTGDQFRETPGVLATYNDESLLHIPGWTIEEAYEPPVAPAVPKLAKVSGRINLSVDTEDVKDISFVTFHVDKKLIGLTNSAPFSCKWDSEKVPNGDHLVEIRGCDNQGRTVTKKSMTVYVQNEKSSDTNGAPESDKSAELRERLNRLMRLSPSVQGTSFMLAECHQALGDSDKAVALLEKTIAINPDYPGASEMLKNMYNTHSSYEKVHKLATTEKIVALTFDDGPKEATNELLDVLREKGVKATFFLVGSQVVKHPDIVKRIAEEGHQIENHTFSHKNLSYLSERDITSEIFRSIVVTRGLTGRAPTYVRPPGGHEGDAFANVLSRYGMKAAMWTENCTKYEGTNKDALSQCALSALSPGAIILMHNVDFVTLDALPQLIDEVHSRGFSFTTLDMSSGKKVASGT